jgi:hypothetical protein
LPDVVQVALVFGVGGVGGGEPLGDGQLGAVVLVGRGGVAGRAGEVAEPVVADRQGALVVGSDAARRAGSARSPRLRKLRRLGLNHHRTPDGFDRHDRPDGVEVNPQSYPTLECDRPELLATLKLQVQVHDLRPPWRQFGDSGSVHFHSVEGSPVCAEPRELDTERLKNHVT